MWNAKVRGSKTYEVNVQLDYAGIECDYTCPAFAQYFDPCKHVAAVLLKIQESESMSDDHTSLQSLSQQQILAKQRISQESERKRQEEERRQHEERQKVYIKLLTEQFIDSIANFANQPLPSFSETDSPGKEQLFSGKAYE